MQRIPHFFLSKRQSVDFISISLDYTEKAWLPAHEEEQIPWGSYLVFRCARFPATGQGAGVFEGLKR